MTTRYRPVQLLCDRAIRPLNPATDDLAIGPDRRPDVAVPIDGERYLVLRGGAQPALESLPRTGALRVVDLQPGLALPKVEGAGTWRGIVHAEDGTLFLISSGSPAIIAWQAARARE